MPDESTYDVFLSRGAKDKAAVRELAERLNATGCAFGSMNGSSGPALHSRLAPPLGLERNAVLFRDPFIAGHRFILRDQKLAVLTLQTAKAKMDSTAKATAERLFRGKCKSGHQPGPTRIT